MSTLPFPNTAIVKPVSFVWVTQVFSSLATLITLSDVENAQAHYRLKRKQQAQAQMHRDIVRDMPLEQKLQLGCYHLMD